ncbi:MAG: 6-phosphogluconolactonase [Pseudobacteriovorax sp.]|nr:6-phosphogluconolactonase [Pseudobacteriovorax sp.]
MTDIIRHEFDNKESMNVDLCSYIVKDLKEGIEKNGSASLVVSGGSTPRPLFKKLSTSDLDWSKVTITLADDRWVGTDHEASNEKLVRDNLLQNKAAKARFIGLKTDEKSPFNAEKTCHQQLSDMPHPFDVVVLGMGLDGHTASMFPCSNELQSVVDEESLYVKAVQPTSAPFARMSLTLKSIINAKHLYIQIAGEDKRDVLDKALSIGDEAEMPIRYVFRTPLRHLHVFWAP